MTVSPQRQPQSPRQPPGPFIRLLVSPDLKLPYLSLVGLLGLAGLAFASVGAVHLLRIWGGADLSMGAAIGYIVGGLLALIAAGWLYQLRKYYRRVEADREVKAVITALDEQDFEEFDRVRALRERKDREDFNRNLTAAFRVESLVAQNILLFPTVKWVLQPGVNVLLGRNGFGKSLIMRSLVGMLQKDEPSTDSLFADAKGSLPGLLELHVRRDGAEELVSRDAKRFLKSVGKVPVLAIPDSRFVDRSILTVTENDPDVADLRKFGAHHFLRQLPYGSVIQGLMYELCLEYLKFGTFKRPSFEFIQDVVFKLTDAKFQFHEIERQGRTGFSIKVRTEGNDDPLPIQYASQGTLSVLAIFGLVRSYLRSLSSDADNDLIQKGSAVVVIDEADAHLHPAWQRKIPGLLREYFPNTQFILSAHSPLFVAGCWRGEAAVLRKNAPETGRGFRLQPVDRDFVGATPSEVYQELFDIDELDETYLKYATKATMRDKNAERINELEESNRLSNSERAELDALLDENSRIRRAGEVAAQRKTDIDKDARIATLERQVSQLGESASSSSEER